MNFSNFSNLFFGFHGRINRARFWLATIVVEVLSLAIQWMFGIPISGDPSDLLQRTIVLVLGVIFTYPTAALAVKRLHDRNRPGNYVWALLAAFAVLLVADFLGRSGPSIAVTYVIWAAMFFATVVALTFLIELGFRRGTPGPNPYGSDPLEGGASQ